MKKNKNGCIELSVKELENLKKIMSKRGFDMYNSFESDNVVGYMFEKVYKGMPGVIETSRITIMTDGSCLTSCDWYDMDERKEVPSNFYMYAEIVNELSKLNKKFNKIVK